MGVLVASQKHGIAKRMRRDPTILNNEDPHVSSRNMKLPSITSLVEGNDDILHEVLKHLDAKSLASASCVNRRWRLAAEDQSLWEGICTRHWPAAANSRPQQLTSVVRALGGFRRLYALCLRRILSRSYPSWQPLPLFLTGKGLAGGRQWSKDEVHLSLSLFSIDCFERLGRRSCCPSSLEVLCRASSSSSQQRLRGSSDLLDVGDCKVSVQREDNF